MRIFKGTNENPTLMEEHLNLKIINNTPKEF